MIFNPLAFIFFIIFFLFLLLFFVTVQIDIMALAFTKIGIPSQYVFTALFASLFFSFVNIPIKRIPQTSMTEMTLFRYFGFQHKIPSWRKKETVLAINLGGAVIPILISLYLLSKTGLWVKAAIATGLMVIATFRMAKPVPGLGIVLPAFVPPILAAIISILIAYSHAPVMAYICGTLVTLIGADILNLKKIANLGAPVASIGGAGTFDGIFLNGILAVLLSALFV